MFCVWRYESVIALWLICHPRLCLIIYLARDTYISKISRTYPWELLEDRGLNLELHDEFNNLELGPVRSPEEDSRELNVKFMLSCVNFISIFVDFNQLSCNGIKNQMLHRLSIYASIYMITIRRLIIYLCFIHTPLMQSEYNWRGPIIVFHSVPFNLHCTL